jgi:hypothetical protein
VGDPGHSVCHEPSEAARYYGRCLQRRVRLRYEFSNDAVFVLFECIMSRVQTKDTSVVKLIPPSSHRVLLYPGFKTDQSVLRISTNPVPVFDKYNLCIFLLVPSCCFTLYHRDFHSFSLCGVIICSGNKFGEPVVAGFARAFGQRLPNGERVEFIKPIMFTAGVGWLDSRHTKKGRHKTIFIEWKILLKTHLS